MARRSSSDDFSQRLWFVAFAPMLLVVVCFLTVLAVKGFASADLSYRTLDYKVQVRDNGDMRITQTIDMKLDTREDDDGNVMPWKQLYQQYTLKQENLLNIKDVSVTNLTTGEKYTQVDPRSPYGLSDKAWNEQYAKHWYIADMSHGQLDMTTFNPATDGLELGEGATSKELEVGWNIPVTESAKSLKFQVEMTWTGVGTAYGDMLKFQWEPVGPTNQVPIGTLNATVTFPDGVEPDNSWAWLHYAGSADTKRISHGLEFTAHDVKSGEHLDLVAMYPVSFAKDVARHGTGDIKQATIDDETRQERQWAEAQRRRELVHLALWVSAAIIGVALSAVALVGMWRSRKQARYTGDIDYWRELPPVSPGAAAELYTVMEGGTKKLFERQMAATVMSLVSKGAIAVYPGQAKLYNQFDVYTQSPSGIARMIAAMEQDGQKIKNTSTIVMLTAGLSANAAQELALSASEQCALEILTEASRRTNSAVFDLKQMNKAFKEWYSGARKMREFTNACYDELDRMGVIKDTGKVARGCGIADIILGTVFSLMFLGVLHNLALVLVIGVPMVAIGIAARALAKEEGLTESGQPLAGQLLGLVRYLEDFSDFSDRGVLDMTLWGRYMVYATACGISGKALKQLAIAYPEVADPAWLDTHDGTQRDSMAGTMFDSSASMASGMLFYWCLRPSLMNSGLSGGLTGVSFSEGGFGGFGDLGHQLSDGFSSIGSTLQAATPSYSGSGFSGSSGSFSSGSFGGSSGGSGGGSFGGR